MNSIVPAADRMCLQSDGGMAPPLLVTGTPTVETSKGDVVQAVTTRE